MTDAGSSQTWESAGAESVGARPASRPARRDRRRKGVVRDPGLAAGMVIEGGRIRVVVGHQAGSVIPRELTNMELGGLPARVRSLRVIGVQAFRAEALETVLDWLDERRVGRVVVVLGAERSAVRVLEPGNLAGVVDREGVSESMRLQAEAQGWSGPAWRLSAGLLPTILTDESGAGLPMGAWSTWAGASSKEDEALARYFDSGVEGGYVAEPIALAGFASAVLDQTTSASGVVVSRVSGERGVISIVAQDAEKMVLRAARIESGAPGSAGRGAKRTILESARVVGMELEESAGEREVSAWVKEGGRVRQIELPVWSGEWGLALGALLVGASEDAAVVSSASMKPAEPVPMVSGWVRAVRVMSRPRVGAAIVAASLAAAVIFPMSGAYARLRILENRAAAAQVETRLADAEQRVGFYRLLREKRWPMTKLLADVSGCAPVGVEVESLEIAQGEIMTVRGSSENQDLVADFRENLGATRVFSQLATPSVSRDGSRVRFQISARVASNAAVYDGAWGKDLDFTQESLGQRLFGADYQPSASGASGRGSEGRGSRGGGGRSSGSSRSFGGQDSSSRTTRDMGTGSVGLVAPEPLTDAQIAAMDGATAMKEWSSRKKAASKAADAEVKRRLQDEAERCRQRMQEAKGSGGGA